MKLSLVLLIASLASSVSGMNADIFVSPSGSDSNPGTREKPLRSARGARDALRSLRSSGVKPSSGSWIVEFADGEYHFEEPIELDGRDSGHQMLR